MTNNPPNPWAEIAAARGADDINTRRERGDSAHNFFWIVDHRGRPGIRFLAPNVSDSSPRIPALSEIDISLARMDDGNDALDLFLRDPSMRDIFLSVCVDLMDTAEKSGADGAAALNAVIARIGEWQRLLKIPRGDLMSKEAQIGLWGELRVLRDLFLAYLPVAVAAEAWSGPCGGEQDFSLAGLTLAEVKTQSAASDRMVKISSADQLDGGSGVLFLVHQTIAPSPQGITLQGMVNAVRDDVRGDIAAFGRVGRSLREYGFADRKDYDEAPFCLSRRKIYRVDGNFPCITRAQIPAGVSDVRYDIDISACEPFIAEEKTVTERIAGYDH